MLSFFFCCRSFLEHSPLLGGKKYFAIRISVWYLLLCRFMQSFNPFISPKIENFAKSRSYQGGYWIHTFQGFDLMANYLGERVKRFLGAGELIFNISAAVSPEVRKTHYRQQPVNSAHSGDSEILLRVDPWTADDPQFRHCGSFSRNVWLTFQMRITLTSIRVTDFDAVSFASKMIVIPGKGIAWRVSNPYNRDRNGSTRLPDWVILYYKAFTITVLLVSDDSAVTFTCSRKLVPQSVEKWRCDWAKIKDL